MQTFNKKQQTNAPKISQEDAEFLAYEVGILLGAALQYAGVKAEKLQDAITLYTEIIDEVLENQDAQGIDEVVQTIEFMRKNHAELFN